MAENELEHAMDNMNFSVKPSRCIALHKGQKCYQTVEFSWRLVSGGLYCLYSSTSTEPLVCWQGKALSSFHYEFQSAESITFYIRNETLASTQAKTKVDVAWVYKNRQKASSGWRLF
ncbi:DUF3019 domain-containing protein [Gilvimarinus sp. SDUM040013]|uniref:DUF3019 domain-containing protein n=1 Tax=Gilvimarinus gilvus TaxID=3058038 RepID=A0ABU4RXP4_9GAMM|nr:DUF3019 domain-containing protein [Gilvimarinus sp. SDUM040013]MDO3387638.1 DUF3019 domain-containing protein [Gilvimarinus sp. SDUM040013]MDX6848921.1 DUF3019 domain-containing protein [Gilvimarinus sp. SDUM040013]